MRERVIATLTQQSYSTTRTGTYTALVSNSSLLAGTHCTTVGWFDCSEHPAILFGPDGQPTSESSQIREAYFMEFAHDIRAQMKTTPLMVTGGIRSRAVMEEALGKGDCEMIGIGRPVCGDPDCVRKLLVDGAAALPAYENQLMLDLEEDDAARRARMRYSMQQSWYYCNEWALGDGEQYKQERRATFDTFNSKTSSLLLI